MLGVVVRPLCKAGSKVAQPWAHMQRGWYSSLQVLPQLSVPCCCCMCFVGLGRWGAGVARRIVRQGLVGGWQACCCCPSCGCFPVGACGVFSLHWHQQRLATMCKCCGLMCLQLTVTAVCQLHQQLVTHAVHVWCMSYVDYHVLACTCQFQGSLLWVVQVV